MGYPATTIEVTCPHCHNVYNIRIDTERKVRNCRCSKVTFEVHQGSGRNQVTVFSIDSLGTRSQYHEFTIVGQTL